MKRSPQWKPGTMEPSPITFENDTEEMTPQEVAAHQIAEKGPKLGIAAQAVMLEGSRRMMRDAQNRVQDSHRAMAKAAGMEDVVGDDQDDMGHLIVTGDINVTPDRQGNVPKMPWDMKEPNGQPQAEQRPQPAQPRPSRGSVNFARAKTAGLVAGGILAGAGLTMLPSFVSYLMSQDNTPAIVQPDPDFDAGKIEIEVIRPEQ